MTAWSLSLTAVAFALAALVTGWFLVAVPCTVVAAYGAWIGLSDEELLDAFDTAFGDDAGRRPTGLSL